jgi:hypothetical protein
MHSGFFSLVGSLSSIVSWSRSGFALLFNVVIIKAEAKLFLDRGIMIISSRCSAHLIAKQFILSN